jgi:hypothetical protein
MAAAASTIVAADFSNKNGFWAGGGSEYQYISQEYFNVVFDTISLDIIETWRLDKDEINDFIFRTNLGYNLRNRSGRINLLADLEVSGDRLLGRSEGWGQIGGYENNLKIFGKFESKSPKNGSDYRVEQYNYYQAYLGGRKKLARPIGASFKVGHEIISFSNDRPDPAAEKDTLVNSRIFPNYDYSLFSSWIGFDLSLSELTSELTCRAGYNRRSVPDSTKAGYEQYRFDLGYSYIGLGGIINLTGEIEIRDYNQPSDQDDFTVFGLQGYSTRSLGDRFELALTILSDFYQYKNPDFVNRDYLLIRNQLESTLKFGQLGWGPLIRLEFRNEWEPEDLEFGSFAETYNQWELGGHTNLFSLQTFFLNGEVTFGERNYREETDILSSYNFWSVSVLANYSIIKNLSINFMFDGTFESHQIREDDTSLSLLSVGVTARI